MTTCPEVLRAAVAATLIAALALMAPAAHGQATAPVSVEVDAGEDRPVSLDGVARLDGSFRLEPEGSEAADAPRFRWRALDGPGPVLMANETRLSGAEAAFLAPGLYRIELQVEVDGVRGSDVVTLQAVDGPVHGRTAYPSDEFYASVRAFPGAEGFGANASGGRGGRIEFVTSLADSGPGSARAALEAEGRRYVIPLVWGYVDLLEGMRVSGDVTYAGQFMPDGLGLAFRNVREKPWSSGAAASTILLSGESNAIFRYLKVYRGVNSSYPDGNGDALTLVDSSDVIVDHSAFALGNDENVNLHGDGTRRVTLQHSWSVESLHYSTHPKTLENGVEHGSGFLSGYGAGDVTLNRSLFYLNPMRNPRLTGEGRYDVVNNLDYNNASPLHISALHTAASEQARAIRANVVGNVREAGPLTPSIGYGMRIWQEGTGAVPSAYLEGNVHPFRGPGEDEWAGVSLGDGARPVRLSSRVDTPLVRTTSAEVAREEILAWGGPSFVQWGGELRGVRDPLLERVVSAARSGGGRDRALGADDFEWPELPSGGIDEAVFWEEYFGPWRDRFFPGRSWDEFVGGYQVIEHFLNAWVPDFPAMVR